MSAGPALAPTAGVESRPSRPLRLLFLAPFPPRLDAAHGGGRVTAQLIARLAQDHPVALACLRAPDEPPLDPELERRLEAIEVVDLPAAGDRGRLETWARVLAGRPLWAAGRCSPEFARRLEALARRWKPDLVQVEFHIMAQYLPALAACPAPRVLVQHEPGEAAARQALLAGQAAGRLLPYLDLLAWRRFERRAAAQVQVLVAFTGQDRQTLLQAGARTPVVTIPPGTWLPARPLDPLGQDPPSVLFFGSFAHPPNREAALRLAQSIFPPVRARFPEARLVIAGRQPPPELQRLAGPGVTVAGQVPDLRPYLDRAAVVAAPLRLGGGMRIKVLEALAAGKAVVASPLAAAGLDLTGEQVLLAGSDAEFSQAIVRLLANPGLRRGLAAKARAWACTHLSWDRAAQAYEGLYHRLLSGLKVEG